MAADKKPQSLSIDVGTIIRMVLPEICTGDLITHGLPERFDAGEHGRVVFEQTGGIPLQCRQTAVRPVHVGGGQVDLPRIVEGQAQARTKIVGQAEDIGGCQRVEVCVDGLVCLAGTGGRRHGLRATRFLANGCNVSGRRIKEQGIQGVRCDGFEGGPGGGRLG